MKRKIYYTDKALKTMPDFGQVHETCGGVKLVKCDPNPLPRSGQRKNQSKQRHKKIKYKTQTEIPQLRLENS